MSDEDFDFRRPAETREPKHFQPPPWEQDAFQKLQEKRGAAEEAQDSTAETTAPEAEPHAASRGAEVVEDGPNRLAPRGPEPNEAMVLEMLAQLRAEDPPATQSIFKVALGSAVVLFAVGGMLIIWSMAALVGSQRTGTFGMMAALTLGLFGAGFVAAGWWMIRKAIKRRGAL